VGASWRDVGYEIDMAPSEKKLASMSADFALRYKLQAENACEQQVLGSEWSSNPTGFGQRVSTKPSASQ
jgi:hypothetical protein